MACIKKSVIARDFYLLSCILLRKKVFISVPKISRGKKEHIATPKRVHDLIVFNICCTSSMVKQVHFIALCSCSGGRLKCTDPLHNIHKPNLYE